MFNQFINPNYDWVVKAVSIHTGNACLNWPFKPTSKGYGRLRINGKQVLAHRFAYFLRHGAYPLPCGLHKCDNRACINPDHIYAGSNAQNVLDRIERGHPHVTRGEDSNFSTLTERQVIEIRAKYAQGGISQNKLAIEFSVARSCIHSIVHRVTWRHI